MSWKALITDAGNELSAKTISGGNIKLTHAKAGSGTVSEQDLHLQTELVNVKQTLSIESIKYSNAVNNIEILLDCRGLKEAYDLAQIGIYATDPDAREILFAIAQTENPKHIPAENEVPFYSIDFNFAFALKNNQNMVATIDQSTFATKEQLSAVDARIDNIIVNAGSTEDNAELIDMRVDVDGKRHSTAGEALRSQLKQKANLTDISSPYQFRGACLSANLPGSGNKINDTYYVTDKKCKFTWNGAAWYQSSLNESDYEEELSSLTEDLADVTIQAQSSNVYDKDNPDMTFEGNIDATGKPVASTGRMTMIVPCEAGHTYSFVKLNTLKTGYINQSTRFSQYTKDGTFNEFLSNNALKTVTPTIDGFLYVMGGNVGFNQMVLKDWDGVIPTEYIEYKKSLLLNSERLNIPIPTRVSELENDSNYVKSNELPSVNEILESFYSSNVYNKDNSDAYIEDYMLTSDGALTQYVGRRVVKVPVNYGDTVCFYTLNSSKTTFGAVATRIAMYTEDGTNLGILSNNDKKMVTINNSSCKYAYISLSNDEQKEKGMIFINLGNVSATFTQYIPYYKRTVVKAENISSQWHGKKWLAYGDSITAISNGEMSCGWARYVTDVLNFGEFYGRGIGGQTYTWNDYTFYANNDGSYNSRDTSHNPPIGTTEHRGCFSSWDRIKTMIPDSIADTIDMIFLMGGTNDINGVEEVGGGSVIEYEIPIWSATNTTDTDWVSSTQYNGGDYDVAKFSGAIASTIMKLQTRCPNAIIVIGTPFSRWSNKLNLEIKGKTMFDVAEVEMKVARFMSMPHIDVNGFCGVNGFNSTEYQPDGVHPKTEKGMKMLGRTIIGGLRGIDPIIQ